MNISIDKDALLLAMCDRLPPLGEVFTSGDQERWLDAMRAILVFLYPPEWSQKARETARKARSGPVEAIRTTVTMDESWGRMSSEVNHRIAPFLQPPEEESSTTSADAVDDASGGEEASDSGAGPAPDTSAPLTESSPASTGQDSSPTSPPESAPTTPSSGVLVPEIDTPSHEHKGVRVVPQPRPPTPPFARRHFTADQRGALIRRVVREGLDHVSEDAMIHPTTLRRWMREMPVSVQTFTEEWEAEQAIAESEPTVAELEAERATPIPAAKPPVQWPTAPIERRPVDPDRVRSHQAGQG